VFFFFNDTATTEIYTLSLHDALPICYAGVLHTPTVSCPNVRTRSVKSRAAMRSRGDRRSCDVLKPAFGPQMVLELCVCPALISHDRATSQKNSGKTGVQARFRTPRTPARLVCIGGFTGRQIYDDGKRLPALHPASMPAKSASLRVLWCYWIVY